MLRLLATGALALGLVTPALAMKRRNIPGLEQNYAAYRASMVSNAKYNLKLSLDPKVDSFAGTIKISFDLKKPTPHLTVDFRDGKVRSLYVNDKKISQPEYKGHFLTLPARALNKGRNTVLIAFSHPYATQGTGLYKFQDPKDKRYYLYTDFEPFDANLMFPHFDQPDIKATYQLEVSTPRNWHVITSVKGKRYEIPSAKTTRWVFKESQVFSSYIFSLHAGPFHVWTDKKARIPSRLFVRQSLAKYVKPEEWFRVTRQGFDYFEAYFNYPYPFDKYDQLIVPDFNASAMENVGAVTFTENYVFRGTESNRQREKRASTILHELAHMWFGNLVTMKWWNDLWLNESFATYMAAKGLVEATEFKQAWESFYLRRKQHGYWEDELVTTHPIEAQVDNTDQAFANFDGITYSKGASVLKQMEFLLGERNFRDGIRKYFQAKKFGNATLKDFLTTLAKASKVNLDQWQIQWLKTESFNTVKADFQCKQGKVSSFHLVQTAPQKHNVLRQHKTKVALLRQNQTTGAFEVYKSAPVKYHTAKTPVSALVGADCPDIVYPNYQDYDFVKVDLDKRTLGSISAGVTQVPDNLLRMMLWQSMWDMVRDRKLPVNDYAGIVLRNITRETNTKTIRKLTRKLNGSVVAYYPDNTLAEKKALQSFQDAKYTTFKKAFYAATPKSERQKIWYSAWMAAASDPKKAKEVLGLVSGSEPLNGLHLDQDKRWSILIRAARFAVPGAKKLIAAEARKDQTARGKNWQLRVAAIAPNIQAKKRAYRDITGDALKFAQQKHLMAAIFPREQEALARQIGRTFYSDLPRLAKSKDLVYLRTFTRRLAPSFCDPASSLAMQSHIAQHGKSYPAIVTKRLRIELQENSRCHQIKAYAAANGKPAIISNPEQQDPLLIRYKK